MSKLDVGVEFYDEHGNLFVCREVVRSDRDCLVIGVRGDGYVVAFSPGNDKIYPATHKTTKTLQKVSFLKQDIEELVGFGSDLDVAGAEFTIHLWEDV